MATADISDGLGGTLSAVQLPLAPGRAAAAASRPIAFSNEDLAEVKRRGSYTDRSTTGTGAGTKVLMSALATRIHAIVQNPSSATESILLAFGANAAAANGLELKPGDPPIVLFTVQEIRVLAPNTAPVIAWELA